jgi:hypothetical protein
VKTLLSFRHAVMAIAVAAGLAVTLMSSATVARASVIGGVNLGAPSDSPHRWGDCNVQDFKSAPGYGWVIVSYGYWDTTGYHDTGPQIVRNGMLWGWFDQGGAPGHLSCPRNSQHNPGVTDQRVVAQDFRGGTLFWGPGMDHATVLDHSRWPAVKWGLQHLGTPYDVGWCLKFVVDAYNVGLYGGRIVLHGGPYDTATTTARAYQWWYTGAGSHPGDVNAPFGMFVVWAGPEAHDGSGHIAIGLGGGYMLTTEYDTNVSPSNVNVHIQRVRNDTNYLGWVVPK